MEIKDALAYMRLVVFDDDEAFERVINLPRRNFGKSRLAALKAMAEESGQSLFAALKASIDNKLFSSTGAPGFIELIDSLRKEKDNLSVSLCSAKRSAAPDMKITSARRVAWKDLTT